jgi:hypothetical protein
MDETNELRSPIEQISEARQAKVADFLPTRSFMLAFLELVKQLLIPRMGREGL